MVKGGFAREKTQKWKQTPPALEPDNPDDKTQLNSSWEYSGVEHKRIAKTQDISM